MRDLLVTSGLASREARNVEGIRAEKERERVFSQAGSKNENVLDLTQGSKADFTARNITAHLRGTTFLFRGALIFICLDCRAISSIHEAKFFSSVV